LNLSEQQATITIDQFTNISKCESIASCLAEDNNGDNVPDSLQDNVVTVFSATLPPAAGNPPLTIEAGGCKVQNVEAKTEFGAGDLSYDEDFDFPQGLISFELPDCESAKITVYYHGIEDASDRTYRKYGPTTPGDSSTEEWYTLPNVTFGTATIGGKTVATATFVLTDGQLGDDTGNDGIIVDDGGIAMPAVVEEVSCQLYAVHDQKRSDSQLFTVSEVEVVDEVGHPVTGTTDNLTFNYQVNTLGPLYKGYDIEAIAVHPVTNRVYAVSGKDVAKNQPRGYLYTVDGQDGELFPIGSTGFKEIEDLAFGNDGTLWAWAKGDGMITIDLATGAGTLVIPSKVKIEGLTLSKNTDHTVFYGSVGKELWVYDLTANQLNVACDNFPGEVEALELLPDGILLIGIHEDKGFSLQAFDVDNCQVIPDFSIPTTPFDDVEGIAFPVEACTK
jgi:hypothetical protein